MAIPPASASLPVWPLSMTTPKPSIAVASPGPALTVSLPCAAAIKPLPLPEFTASPPGTGQNLVVTVTRDHCVVPARGVPENCSRRRSRAVRPLGRHLP